MTTGISLSGARLSMVVAYPQLSAAWACRGGLALLWLAAALLMERRLNGALTAPHDATVLWTAASAWAVAAAGLRWLRQSFLSRSSVDRRTGKTTIGWNVGLSAAIVVFGTSLSLPDATAVGWAGLWLILSATEALGWWQALHRSATCPRREPQPSTLPEDGGLVLASEAGLQVDQRLVRGLDATGQECAQGWIRARFLPGQRTAAVHLAFCPPFTAAPRIETQQLDGRPSRIRASQVLACGARLEIKLETAAPTAESVRVQFSAVELASSRTAVVGR